ncbi:MAG: glycosyltransferase [Verrucomicrobia bacterium]|nr:glycosyltransferase [Verrucomicrobiota bacterium]
MIPPPKTVALSLVIPAYQEAARLPDNLRRIADFLRAEPLPGVGACEVLVVVEKSADDTLGRCREAVASLRLDPAKDRLRIDVLDNQVQRGKGYAVRCGILRAAGEIVLFMDADLSTPLPTIPRFLTEFQINPEIDVLIGNRRHATARMARRQGWLRRQLGGLFSVLARLFSGGLLPPAALADTQCGFKVFRRHAAREIFSRARLDSFSFDVEILALARALGLCVADLPVDWKNSPASTLRLARDGWGMLRDLLRVRSLVRRSLRARPAAPASRRTFSPLPASAANELASRPAPTHD